MPKVPDTNLTPVQFEILEVAWKSADVGKEGASVAEIWNAISASRDVGRTTVLKLVDRLEKRGWFTRQKVDGVFRYTPTVGRDVATSHVADEFVEAFFSGSASDLVMNLLGSKKISPGELDQVRQMLEKKQAGRRKSKESRK